MNILNIFEKELQTNLIGDNNTNNSYKTYDIVRMLIFLTPLNSRILIL